MTRVLASALATAALVAACGDKPAPPSGTAQKDPFTITAGPALAARLKIGDAREAEVRETLRVPGRVEVDETRVARVGSPVTGRVSELEVREGDDVKRGQILATLTSTELSNAQLEYLKAYSQKLVAERAAGRAQQLLDADVIGAAELQRRQADAVQAEADLNAAGDRLKVLGMSERAIARLGEQRRVDSTSHIVSSIAGTVIDRKVSPARWCSLPIPSTSSPISPRCGSSPTCRRRSRPGPRRTDGRGRDPGDPDRASAGAVVRRRR
jgi:cobalt-zinc-cadmium efflux system membrane fusion protein